MRKIRTKGQMGIENAPAIVLLIGLTFLTLATIAFIGEKYGNTLDVDNTDASAVNESVVSSVSAGLNANVAASVLENVYCGNMTVFHNGTGGISIPANVFTQTGCNVVNATSSELYGTTLKISYPYTYSASTSASNASGDLVDALGSGTAWITIIIVVGFAVVVLGAITSGLGKASQQTEQGSVY